jgi:enoyl-CoA hydratase/carnithine racemase
MSVIVSSSHRILRITLNRPEKRNALNKQMTAEIVDAVTGAQERRDIACILMRANGSVFCAGMDLDEASTDRPELSALHEKLFTIGLKSLKPIVAVVNGAALGGGLGLAAQAHMMYAGDGAVFGLPEIQVGLWPFLVFRCVSSALGQRRTLAISLSGRSFSAAEAHEWGLVHRVLPGPEIEERGHAMARRLAKASPMALALGMRYVKESAGKSWDEAGELAATLRVKLMESGDFQEGREAFKQKREAHWPSMPAEFYSGQKPGHSS